MPTDKSHIEQVFDTIKEQFVQGLAGYKGPDLFSRGKHPEEEAFFFIDEIEEFFAEWVATYWQRRAHDGLEFSILPKMKLSPNDMYEEGIARAGFVYMSPDKNLYFDLLPTEWRTIQHYGVDLNTLRYDGQALEGYRNQPSPYKGVNPGLWPIRYDPRDLSRAYFFDVESHRWETLTRTGSANPYRPFDDKTLNYAKSLVLARGAKYNHASVSTVLDELLNKLATLNVQSKKERRTLALNVARAMAAQKDRSKADLADLDVTNPAEPEDAISDADVLTQEVLLGFENDSLDVDGNDIGTLQTLDDDLEDFEM